MIISFAHTTSALLAGRKTVTRREWSPRTVAYFQSRLAVHESLRFAGLRPGVATDAYDKSPRNGGKKVAQIAVESVTRERLLDMPESDYEAEGFAWLEEQAKARVGGLIGERFAFEQLGGDVWHLMRRNDPRHDTATLREYFDFARWSPRQMWVVRFRMIPRTEATA